MRFLVALFFMLAAAVQVLASDCTTTCMIRTVQQSFKSDAAIGTCYTNNPVSDL